MSDYGQKEREDAVDWAARSRAAEEEYNLSQLRGYEPVHPEPAWRSVARKLWVPIAFVGALFWKFKAAAVVVFKFKFVGTALSGLVSVAAYALLWSWWFAVGLVVLLFIHEMGHVLEAKRQGLPVSAPMFIPFLGALITLKELPDDVWREARVALAGPIVGTLGACAGPLSHCSILMGRRFGRYIGAIRSSRRACFVCCLLAVDMGRQKSYFQALVWPVLRCRRRAGGVPERLKGTGCKPVGARLRRFESYPLHHALDRRGRGIGARV